MAREITINEDDEISGGEMAPVEADQSLAIGLSRSEIDVQITTARRFPRRISKVVTDILSLATLDEEAAEECMYALPRGSKPIQGPSIRFAEIVESCFGNCRSASRITYVDRVEKVVVAEGVFHDLETNKARRQEVRRRIVDKKGRLYSDDMIVVTGNAAASIALRNAILGGVPRAIWRKAFEKVKHTIAGDITTLSATREKAVLAFANYGIKPEQVFAALEVGNIEDIKLDSIPVLRGMFAALKNGEATVEEMFGGMVRKEKELDKDFNPLLPADASPGAASATAAEVDRQDRGVTVPAQTEEGQAESDPVVTDPPASSGGTESSSPAPTGPSETEAEMLRNYSTALMRGTQVSSLDTIKVDFWRGKTPKALSQAAQDMAGQIYSAHVRRCRKVVTSKECEAEVETIIAGTAASS